MKRLALVVLVVLSSFAGGVVGEQLRPRTVEAQGARSVDPTYLPGPLTVAGAVSAPMITATTAIWMNGAIHISQANSSQPISTRGGTAATTIFQNQTGTGTTKFAVMSTGAIRPGIGNTTAQPTCDSTIRNTYYVVEGGAGVKDTVAICQKDAANAYAWRTVY